MARLDLTGQVYGRLTVLARGRDYVAPSGQRQSVWICRCECGETVERRGAHLRTGRTTSCGCWRREAPYRHHGKDIGYFGAHARVVRKHGPARGHSCVDCGAQAEEWSYTYRCPDEKYDDQGHPFCPAEHDECYEARCVLCHRTYDMEKAA